VDTQRAFVVSGNGDIIEPDDGIVAIGSGGPYALAAARAFRQADPGLGPAAVVERALRIAAGICVYTNDRISILELPEGGDS